MHDVGTGPRDPVENDQSQRPARHVDAVPDRVGAEQAGIFLGSKHVDQGPGIERVHVLGEKAHPCRIEWPRDPIVDGTKPVDRGKQAEPAATGGEKQLAVGRRHLVRVVAVDVVHHQHPGLAGIVERRRHRREHRRRPEMPRAGPDLGGGPVDIVVAGPVAKGCRGDQNAMGRFRHRRDERPHRIDPVPVQADVDVAAIQAVDAEPVDELRRGFTLQGTKHRPPTGDRLKGTPFEAAAHSFDSLAGVGLQFGRLGIEQLRKRLDQRRQRPAHSGQFGLQGERGFDQSRNRRADVRLQAVRAVDVPTAGIDLLAHQGEEGFGRADRCAAAEPLAPTGPGEHPDRPEHLVDRVERRGIVGDQIAEPFGQPPASRSARFLGSSQPPPKLGRLASGEVEREGAVGGIEKMVSLVEHVTNRQSLLVAAERGLDHHQGMVGDDDVRPSCFADRAFDEALAIVAARRVDALAARIGEIHRQRTPEQIGEPGREIAADHVAVAGRRRPPRDQTEDDGVDRVPLRQAGHRLVEVEQAKDVLPALANHHLAGLDPEIGVGVVELTIELALQVAGVRADPHRTAVLLHPDRGRSDVPQRLSDPRSGFGKNHSGLAGAIPGGERRGRMGGVLHLLRPALGVGAKQLNQSGARLDRFHRPRLGRRLGAGVLPFPETVPHLETAADVTGGWRFAAAKGAQHRRSPRPVSTRHRPGDRQSVISGRRRQLGQQRPRGREQRRRLLLERPGYGEKQRRCQSPGGRQTEPGRTDKGKQLENVIGGKPCRTQPTSDRPSMTQHRHGIAGDPPRRISEAQRFHLTRR